MYDPRMLKLAAAIAVSVAVAGCGSTSYSPTPTTPAASDVIPRISPIPITPDAAELDRVFAGLVSKLPIEPTEAKLLAISICMAFRQNPGTSMRSAVAQIGAQRGWTNRQATVFLNAATSAYCPQYRDGS